MELFFFVMNSHAVSSDNYTLKGEDNSVPFIRSIHYSDVLMNVMGSQITDISTVTSGFLAQWASNAENVFIWWCHHERTRKGEILDVSCKYNL